MYVLHCSINVIKINITNLLKEEKGVADFGEKEGDVTESRSNPLAFFPPIFLSTIPLRTVLICPHGRRMSSVHSTLAAIFFLD